LDVVSDHDAELERRPRPRLLGAVEEETARNGDRSRRKRRHDNHETYP
jgi:hypothetical protein